MRKILFAIITLISLTAIADDYDRGVDAYNNGNLSTAKQYFDACISENPKDVKALTARSLIFQQSEMPNEALSDINDAIKYNNKHYYKNISPLYEIRGNIYVDIDEYAKAIDNYTKAIKKDKKNDSHYFKRANAYYLAGDIEASDADFNTVIKLNPEDPGAYTGLARNASSRKDYDEAIRLLQKSISNDSTYKPAYIYLIDAYAAKGDYKAAIDTYVTDWEQGGSPEDSISQVLIDNQPDYFINRLTDKVNAGGEKLNSFLKIRAYVYEGASRYQEALADYMQLEQDQDNNGDRDYLLYREANCYIRLGNYLKAIETYSNAIELNDNSGPLYMYRGNAYENNGDFDMAIKDYTHAAELAPYLAAHSYELRGYAYWEKGDKTKAMADYSLALDLDSTSSFALLHKARLLGQQGDSKGMKANAMRILKVDTTYDSDSYAPYALFLIGKPQEAKQYMEKIVTKSKSNKNNAFYNAACLYSLAGDKDTALSYLQKSFDNGFIYFSHIKRDPDLNAIRDMPEFTAMVDKYKAKYEADQAKTNIKKAAPEEITTKVAIKTLQDNKFSAPCRVNNMPMRFIYDPKSNGVSISTVESAFLIKNGYIATADVQGKESVVIKSLKIGDFVLTNVVATIIEDLDEPIRISKPILEKFGRITIDESSSTMTLTVTKDK
ncbi:MAG: tetratricopeptide repeat protein [Muribaculaceae bacterium]|jgi:tetratricopeptide (TPR) repeat protein|nr:tetratricopeptide repeat protein [Muribaculaceae bacterium]